MIMTSRPKAIPNTAMETIDLENLFEVPLSKNILLAMKYSVLKRATENELRIKNQELFSRCKFRITLNDFSGNNSTQ